MGKFSRPSNNYYNSEYDVPVIKRRNKRRSKNKFQSYNNLFAIRTVINKDRILQRPRANELTFVKPYLMPGIDACSGITYSPLYPYDTEFEGITSLITTRSIIIDNVLKICNPFLEKAYELKRELKQIKHGSVKEEVLFHGTAWKNVNSICTSNFNWRFEGSNSGHKYGHGVNFSRLPTYAAHYTDHSYQKVLVVAKVLVVKSCKGTEDIIVPPEGFDTTIKDENGSVIVKYDDNEFYPTYVIYFHLKKDEQLYYY